MLLSLLFLILSPLIPLAFADPYSNLGISFDDSPDSSLPILTLPYGSYRAWDYDNKADVYLFRNIRYAAPPTGRRRWEEPAQPFYSSTLEDGSYGPQCIGYANPVDEDYAPMNEDCLFLDLYLPGKVVREPGGHSLPVVQWIHGGDFMYGSKEQFNEADKLIQASNGSLIFVVPNYRLGAFGFLAGSTVERFGTPNAGLLDQRAAFTWTKRYMNLVGGDPRSVSAWGQGAGAASVMYHLTLRGGRQDPLFQKAILNNIADEGRFDRQGTVQEVFNKFRDLAGCDSGEDSLRCLRRTPQDKLQDAQRETFRKYPLGRTPFGPTVDGSNIRQHAALELSEGNFWHGIESLIISSEEDAANRSAPREAKTVEHLRQYIRKTISSGNNENDIVERVLTKYAESVNDADVAPRLRTFIDDRVFLCPQQTLIEAYSRSTRVYAYKHTSPLLNLTSSDSESGDTLEAREQAPLNPSPDSEPEPPEEEEIDPFQTLYTNYLISHAVTGDPNRLLDSSTVQWDTVSSSPNRLHNTLSFSDEQGFVSNVDQSPRSVDAETTCRFWRDIWSEVAVKKGYPSPPPALEYR